MGKKEGETSIKKGEGEQIEGREGETGRSGRTCVGTDGKRG